MSNGVNWQIFGHQRAKNILEKQLAQDKFPHAYLFWGLAGLGKKQLAMEFAHKVLSAERLDNHPDFQILDANGEITMELALEFVSRLSLKPFLGKRKIAIIDNAQNLNQHSSNALLKTLEEPSASTIIILIASPGKILPTIISRCQVLNFSGFSRSQMEEFAEANKLKINPAMLDLSFGSLATLRALSQDSDFFREQSDIVESYKNATKASVAEKLTSINTLADLETDKLEEQLSTWLFWQLHRLEDKPEDYQKVQALTDSLNGLRQNKNKKLVLQGLMLKI